MIGRDGRQVPVRVSTPIPVRLEQNISAKGLLDMRILQGNQARIRSLAISPDSQLLVSGDATGNVCLWNLATSACRLLFQHSQAVNVVAFSPCGKYVASGGEDRRVCLLNTKNGKLLANFGSYNNSITSLVFAPDGKTLVTGAGNRTALSEGESRVWNTEGLRKQEPKLLCDFIRQVPQIDGKFALRFGGLWCLAYAANGHALAFAMKHVLAVVDPGTWQAIESFASLQSIRSIAFSPDSRLLAFSTARDAILAETPRGKQRPLILKGHKNLVTGLSFTPNGRKLITGSWDHTVRVWEVNMSLASTRKAVVIQQALETFDWQVGKIDCIAVAPNGMTTAVGGESGDIVIWDLND